MSQLKSSSPEADINNSEARKLGDQFIEETVNVETKKSGFLSNFISIATSKTYQIFLNIIGDYQYKSKNEFSVTQKEKILEYLKAKVLTGNQQLAQLEKNKFIDYDPHFLDKLPDQIEPLRNKIIKGRTNLDSAQKTLQNIQNSKKQMAIKYLNEQAYEFEKARYNSVAWGLLIGSLFNLTIYRNGSTIRKAALLLTSGHIFGIISYSKNLNRYFDSVYPIFQEDAVEYTADEKMAFKDWKPQGGAKILE